MSHPYEKGLEPNEANYTPLTPVSFLAKAAYTYPQRVAVIHGELRRTWKQVFERSRRLASALAKRGIRRGDTVAAMLPNVPAMIELHFGPAMMGAVLNTLNTRLDAEAIAFMLDHGEARVLFTDREFSATVKAALRLAKAISNGACHPMNGMRSRSTTPRARRETRRGWCTTIAART